MLTLTGYDMSHRLRHNAPPRLDFKFMNDSMIVAQIAAENLLIPMVDPSPLPPHESLQPLGSDWALLQELADRNFFQLYVHWDKLYFQFPRQTERTVLEWGKNLSSFSPRLSTAGQYGIQIIRGYDYKLAQNIVAILPAVALGAPLDDIIERLGSAFVDQLLTLGRHVVRDQPVSNYLEAAEVAKATLQQILQGLYEGSGSCIGLPKLRARQQIEIRGVGRRFSGVYSLSSVNHSIDAGGYRTTFQVSQQYTSGVLPSLRKKIAAKPPPNQQPKVKGVMVGKVVNNLDPEKLGRVQLSFPTLSDLNISAWARMATPMAGGTPADSWGAYFLPDIGDEVLVAFEQDDINRPVVLGALWNGKARPPEMNKGTNARKVIKTKTGMQLVFDETPGQENLTLQNMAGSTIKMASATGDISLQHPNGSSIMLKADGTVSINVKSNLELKAGGDITLDATNVNVRVKNAMDVS